MFTINIGKAHPNSFIYFSLILKKVSYAKSGHFTVIYTYEDENGEKKKESTTHPIKLINSEDWLIDQNTIIEGPHTKTMHMTPSKRIIFDGRRDTKK